MFLGKMKSGYRLCSHLVPEHWCLSTEKKRVVFRALETLKPQVPCSARVQGRDLVLGLGHRGRILARVLGV